MNNNFANNLKKIRKDHGLSQEQLAEELGVSRQAISKWESSVAYPEMDKIITICKKYDVNIDDLLHRDITQVKNDEETNIKYNKLVNTVFNNITDSIDMFIKLSFKNKVRLILENIILVCIFAIGMVIVNGLTKTLLHEMFEMLPYRIESLFVSVLTTAVLLAYLLFVIIILIRTFKTRYLDYYLQNKNNKVEEEKNEDKKDVVIEEVKNENKIIIRDPKNSDASILKGLVDLFFFGVRVFNFFVLLGVIGTLVFGCFCTFLALYHITVHPIFVSFTFLGIFGIAACIVFAIMLFGFVFKKKNNVKFLFILLLLSIVGAAISAGSIFMNAANFEVVEVNTVTNTKELVYNDDLYFVQNRVSGNDVKFVIDNSIPKNKIILESAHSDSIENVVFDINNNVITCSYDNTQDRYSFNYKYKYLLPYIKDNKIPRDSIIGTNVTIKGNEANIKKIIANSTKDVISDVVSTNDGYILDFSNVHYEKYVCVKNDFYNTCYGIIAEDRLASKEIDKTTFTYDGKKLNFKNDNLECEENETFIHKSFVCSTN